MKSLLLLILLGISTISQGQQYTPAITLAAGANKNGFTKYIEAGAWGKQQPIGVFTGVHMYSVKTEVKDGQILKEPIADPYIKFTAKLNNNYDCSVKFIHSASVSVSWLDNVCASYRACLVDYTTMAGIEIQYGTRTSASIYGIIIIGLW